MLELAKLLPDEELIQVKYRGEGMAGPCVFPLADRYIYAAGYLAGARFSELTTDQINATLALNLINAMRFTEEALKNPVARICLIGSNSATAGSYDELYAASKAGLVGYCASKRVTRTQQLTIVCPPLISDAGMTIRRKDFPEVLYRRKFSTSLEVATTIKRVLWDEDNCGIAGVLLMTPKSGPLQRQGEGLPC